MKPLVSIIIPVYNSAGFLSETINSAKNQTWSNIEIIVVDDGSTDDSFSIAKKFESENISVFKQKNAGACRARNLGFEKSKGKYIQFLDADDLLSEEKISSQMRIFEKYGDLTVASCAWGKFQSDKTTAEFNSSPLFKDYPKATDLLIDMWEKQRMMQTSVWLTPRGLIEMAGPWNEGLSLNQDGEFFCRVLCCADSVSFSKSAKIYYRTGISNSVSKSTITYNRAESLLLSYFSYQTEIEKLENSIRVKQALARNYYSFIYQFYPTYPDLSEKAIQRVTLLDINPPNNSGGRFFNSISKIIGFYNTLRLRKLLANK